MWAPAPQHLRSESVLIYMRIRLAIYGAASLLLLAFYAPARAVAALISGVRER
jgi:hypothetical protein